MYIVYHDTYLNLQSLQAGQASQAAKGDLQHQEAKQQRSRMDQCYRRSLWTRNIYSKNRECSHIPSSGKVSLIHSSSTISISIPKLSSAITLPNTMMGIPFKVHIHKRRFSNSSFARSLTMKNGAQRTHGKHDFRFKCATKTRN